MLRPERMSRVSVTGAQPVMDDVIETVHDLHLLHVTEYDGEWEGFERGDPIEGVDQAAERLVTVRSLESILDLEDETAGPTRTITDEDLETELEEIRTEVNDLDDRRAEIEDELNTVEDRLASLEPFVALGIDLDLLWGYESLTVAVGEGDAAAVEAAIADADEVAESEVFAADDAVAAFVYPAEGVDPADLAIEDLLVGVPFTSYEIPDAEGSPADYRSELTHRRRQLESRLETVEGELADIRLDVAGFLLAAEETLSIDVQKREAPLSFATTTNAFVAEGWIPTERVDDLDAALDAAVGEHVDVSEHERAQYDSDGHAATSEHVDDEADGPGSEPAAIDGGAEPSADETAGDQEDVRADGGTVTMSDEGPPVLQDNPSIVQPFELLTNAVGRPNYSELDPTIILFLTVPLMFGFMIGDVGYGIIYTGLGYYAYTAYDSDLFRQFGFVAIAAGLMTILFGILYGEIFGFHFVTTYLWEPILGHPPIEKGLTPATAYWAETWFVVTALFGLVHLDIGYVYEFVENLQLHGLWETMKETGSWLFAINGLWLFVFSRLGEGTKPELLFTVFDQGEGAAFELGFSGLPVWAGWVGVGMIVIGLVLLLLGPAYEIIEFHQTLAHVLSYLRIGAVLLAKAGMAFAVNLLFFGAYNEHGEFHFMLTHGPNWVAEHHPEAEVMFPGLIHLGLVAGILGIVVLLIGHLVVLLLGITSAGIQAIRLEYFEFFSKFYEGGGTPYSPFGYDRQFTPD